jgi:hypothetical protein
VITQKGGGTERTNSRQIVRPVRSVPGFQFSAKFRLSAPDAVALENSAAGIRLQDRQGNAIALHFDGAGYSVSRSYVRQGRVLTGSSSVRAAFGDEAETWHVMTMRYRFDLSRLDVLLDGEPVADQKVELGVCRFGVFARVTGEGACRAEFQEVACGLP